MDTGEYDTNTLLINNLAGIAYRIYEPVASQSSTYTFNASDVEDALRSDGHLVYMDAVRRGIWCFYLRDKDPSLTVQPEQIGLTVKMEVCGYLIGLVEEGSFDPLSLHRSRSSGQHATHTPSSSSSSGSALDIPARVTQPFNPAIPIMPGNGPVMMMDNKLVTGPIPDMKGYSSVPLREIHEFFITAALSSLTTAFCHKIGAIPLNHRTVLLPSQVFQPGEGDFGQLLRTSAIATFRVYLTTTGSLIISLCVSLLQGLISSADARSNVLSAGPVILAAPLGAFGAMQGIVDSESHVADGGFGQSPDTQITRLRQDPGDKFSQWKSTCARLLQMRGMSPSLLEGCAWLNIHFLQRKPYGQGAGGKGTPLLNSGPTAPWPSVLCFRKPKIEPSFDGRLEKGQQGGAEYVDPLREAKDWCKGLSERDEALERRAKERVVVDEPRDLADGDARNPPISSFSPLNIRRLSNGGAAAAAGMMYPTPPDGVQQLGVTPSFDGTVLSPGNQPAATAMAEMETVMHQPVPGGMGSDGGWTAPEQKREQQPGASFLEGENIYGDLGENMFEGNELTDADFNFFDEDPGGGFSLPGLGDLGQGLDMAMDISHDLEPPPQMIKVENTHGNPRPPAPEFTKPELKHARSTLAEESRQTSNMESYNANSAVGIKRHPSPFNSETVYKRIRASIPTPPIRQYPAKNTRLRRRSVFEKVDFSSTLSLTNKKYQESGPFNYTIPSIKGKEGAQINGGVGPLTAAGAADQSKKLKNLKELPSSIGFLLSRIGGGPTASPPRLNDVISDSGESDVASDDDDLSDTTGAPSSPAKSSVVKRRPDDDVISMAASFKDLENTSADSPGYGHIDLSRLSVPEIPELSLTKYFADPEPAPLYPFNSDSDLITIAQILTEQAASGSLRLGPQRPCSELGDVRRSLANAIRYSVQGLQKSLPQSLSGAAECQLRPFIEVQDVSLLPPAKPPQQNPQQRGASQARPVGQEPTKPPIWQIPSPHIELRRHETQLSVLPSAMSFWEILGLGPSRGPKDVVSICVFPSLEGMRESAASFVERIRSTYESFKLGTFEPLASSSGVADGLFPFFPDQETVSPGLGGPRTQTLLTDNMTNLIQALASSSLTEKNFVVYFVYSPDNPSSIVDSCAAFLDLFEHYKKAMVEWKKSILNDLVLQLVPLDLVAMETSMGTLTPLESARLCLETYDRCTLFGGAMPAPAIILEQALPKSVDFKVTTTPSPNLLRENSHIHIAYAQSVDERWVSVAWTDNQGSKQMTASYCLGRRGKPLSTALSDVAHEIWDTTNDLISMWKVHWKVIITKCGPMDQQEADIWTGLAQNEQPKTPVSLCLMTVDTNPSLQLVPPVNKISLTAPSAFYTTPVSTPQPSIVSPDQSGNPPTPMGGGGGTANATTPGGNEVSELEADATLVDVTDATWGVVVSHRLNNSTSLTELNPSLASGYLIKRCSARPEDAPVAMEVNIVHTDQRPVLYENLLRDMLLYFRGLGTLARARGVVDREADVRPWHVAAAEKAVRALYQLM
ncbi:mediator complex subunit 13 C-terminal-domain-containing protein [Cercophora newfieldiana]|uniref:Mediator of RNA polymerase II transcription subunit 13 n=1 Tax=Cercophora newfieldiana TaxID=92897 RepID=A0AA39XVU4_9PEZI|nr:mediator complex subunit 13 C-terminal-domain-containing protein [Cercophora newfieldiana]